MPDYKLFKEEIFKLCGIDLNIYKERQIKGRIDALISRNKYSSYEEYLFYLENNRDALEELKNYITINISEFYRNPEQWEILEKSVIPYLQDTFADEIKIWCAGCSSGEEPYGLAMILAKFPCKDRIKIIATDIDYNILSKAKEGIYSKKSIENVPEIYRNLYFRQLDDDTFEVKESIKSMVEFRRHDMVHGINIPGCNLIVCRNVVIYFNEEVVEEVYKRLYSSLKNGGVLFLGNTEQIFNYKEIGFEKLDSFFYKKG